MKNLKIAQKAAKAEPLPSAPPGATTDGATLDQAALEQARSGARRFGLGKTQLTSGLSRMASPKLA